MKYKLPIIVLLAITALPPITASAKVTTKSAIQVLELSGLTRQVLEYPKSFNEALKDASADQEPLPTELTSVFPKTIKQAVIPSEILIEVAVPLTREMDESEMQELIDWFSSDLGRAIISAEYEANKTDQSDYIFKNMDNLLNDSRRADFASFIERLYDATELDIQSQEELLVATLSATAAYENPGVPINQEQFRIEVKSDLNKARPGIKKLMIASLVHTYRDIGERDLVKFEMFLGSNAAQKYYNLTKKGLGIGLRKALTKWVKAISEHFNQS